MSKVHCKNLVPVSRLCRAPLSVINNCHNKSQLNSVIVKDSAVLPGPLPQPVPRRRLVLIYFGSGGRRPPRRALVVGGGLSPPSPSSRSYLVPPRASRRPRFLCHCYERWRRRFTRNSGARHKTGAVRDPKRTAPRQRDGQARATHAASLERAAAASIAPSSRSYFVVLCGALTHKRWALQTGSHATRTTPFSQAHSRDTPRMSMD